MALHNPTSLLSFSWKPKRLVELFKLLNQGLERISKAWFRFLLGNSRNDQTLHSNNNDGEKIRKWVKHLKFKSLCRLSEASKVFIWAQKLKKKLLNQS